MSALPESVAGLQQFRRDSCYSYVLFDRASRQAAVIDPRVDLMQDYRAFLAENGLKPVYALDTQLHCDHFSASHLFRTEFGSEIGMAALTPSARPTLRLRAGERLPLGALSLEVLETPGHTEDSICLVVQAPAPLAVFTGDTLWIGLSGRVEMGEAGIPKLWQSLTGPLLGLPEEVLLFPAHCGGDLLFSTIGTEKKRNPHLRAGTLDEFSELKKKEPVPVPDLEMRRRMEFNSSEAPTLSTGECQDGGPFGPRVLATNSVAEESPVSTINVQKFAQKLQSRGKGSSGPQLFVDVREPGEFQAGHFPGMVNLPLSELGFHLSRLLGSGRVYFACLSGRRGLSASRTLSYVGHPDVVNVTGGFKAWQNAGFPVEKN
ncbi:MAG: MBL fold metallo-hydrolase [Oligoflexia bacterium]|nr:MBL fold metallo-hydrolase [Oligoflexia bacterium]